LVGRKKSGFYPDILPTLPQRIYARVFKNRNPYRTTDTHNIRKPEANEPIN